jgi:hypothetical protein
LQFGNLLLSPGKDGTNKPTMTPAIHLFASWIFAAKTTHNLRDCRLVTLAGMAPDLDGLGLVIDVITHQFRTYPTNLYEDYHHYLLHGIFGGLGITLFFVIFAKDRWRVILLALAVFHLHLLCDFVGSRGPSPEDLWPIFYLGPLQKDPMWIWTGQWELYCWPNRLLAVALFGWSLCLAVKQGQSFLGVFNRRLDAIVVVVLRKWVKSGN